MPKLSDLLAEKAKAEVQVGGSMVPFMYWALWRERFSEEELQAHLLLPLHDYLTVWLPRVVISWDIFDDEGHAVPLTAEAIGQYSLPDALLLAFHSRIINSELSGKALSSNNSRAT